MSEGVDLVGQTGQALKRIAVQVSEINAVVSEIAGSTQEQATALEEVNAAINQMDQVTQQNAAMVEQSTAASRSLAQDSGDLAGLVGQFQVGATAASVRPARPADRPTAQPRPALRTTGRGGAALKPEATAPNEDWAEF